MKPGETLAEFYERFSSIIIELTSLEKEYSNREIALKVMRGLPREWDVKTIAMRVSKDLNKLELHDLFADLKAYEFELRIQTEEDPSTSQQTKALPATIVNLPVKESSGKKSAEQLSNEAMPRKDEKKSGDRRRVKDNKRFIKKKSQRVLVVEEEKDKWAESESERSIFEESSSESEDEKVECLMAKEDQESTNEMIFDFNSDEFTQVDLFTALHDMVDEFKRLSQQFNEAKIEKQNLENKLTLSSCSQQKEVNGLRVKLSLLTAENDDLRRLFHATLKENKRLINTVNTWNKSSVSLNRMQEMQKPETKKKELEESIWFLDSGCSRHMTGSKDLLSEVIYYKGPTITFGDNSKGKAVCKGNIMLTGHREQNTYKVKWNDDCLSAPTCFVALNGNKNWLWHKRLNNLNFKSIATIRKLKLVSGLPSIDFAKDRFRNACQLGKQVRSTFESKGKNSSARCLELLHMDMFGPIPVTSLWGKKYTLVVIDDFSRFTWVTFLNSKDQTTDQLIKLLKRLQNEKSEAVDKIRSDRGTEFLNRFLSSYLEDHGIKHELSAARSPQQNGLAERRNHTLKEATRTMLTKSGISQRFWADPLTQPVILKTGP
ncbi:uncharacterized protein LOC142550648 [Primulina tabacum]|uniref:uncharacterized protein LOC142550648 n=1 Tax=Primulina tabacum TaxID=48773 RepID=UPI003F5A496F